eukprot:2461911-Lingulodinium_polyedra.AAC.1
MFLVCPARGYLRVQLRIRRRRSGLVASLAPGVSGVCAAFVLPHRVLRDVGLPERRTRHVWTTV